MAANAIGAGLELDWKSALETQAQDAAMKKIAASEVNTAVSNKREFHGIIPFRKLLGDERASFETDFVYIAENDAVISGGYATWYNNCENSDRPYCADNPDQWNLYTPATLAERQAKAGDTLLVAKMPDNRLMLVMTPAASSADQWIRAKFPSE